jgi:hypothetical protein
MGEPMEGEYRDAGRLARAVRIWTLLWMASQVLFGLASAYEVSVISTLPPDTGFTFTSSPPEMAGSDMATGATGLATVILFWVSGILILRWIHRSNANANLMKPFQGVREAWQASQGSPSWRDVPVPGFMRWWWAFWLLTNLLDNASFRLSLRVETVAQESSVAILSVLSSMFSIPLGFLLIRLVRELTEAQRVQHNSLVFH